MEQLSRRSILTGAAGAGGAGVIRAPGAAAAEARPGAGPFNLIVIVMDTWGAYWLNCYGHSQVRTPHVDALASKSAMLLDAYPEALPTLPARRAIYTGRRIFPSPLILQRDDGVVIRGWHQLYTEDVTLAEALHGAGYRCGLVTDVYHQFKPDKNFHRGFDSWRYIRGQEGDRLESGPRKAVNLADYVHPSQAAMLKRPGMAGPLQYLLNRRGWKSEDDWLAAQVFREASAWLENNARDGQPFYLHVESFSPHEYWDPPESYYRMYMKSDYRGPRLIQPPATTADMTAVEVEHVRALYAGFVTFADQCAGKLLNKAESLGLMDDTAIVFTADHGTMMGEQGQLHKGENRLRRQVTQVPLIVYHPGRRWAGRRVQGAAQHTDILPTALDVLGVKRPMRVTGESLVPLIESGRTSPVKTVITGWGEHGAIRTPEWCYIGRWSPGPVFNELYDVQRDPDELKNVAGERPQLVREFRTRLMEHVEAGWALTGGTFATMLKGPMG